MVNQWKMGAPVDEIAETWDVSEVRRTIERWG